VDVHSQHIPSIPGVERALFVGKPAKLFAASFRIFKKIECLAQAAARLCLRGVATFH